MRINKCKIKHIIFNETISFNEFLTILKKIKMSKTIKNIALLDVTITSIPLGTPCFTLNKKVSMIMGIKVEHSIIENCIFKYKRIIFKASANEKDN